MDKQLILAVAGSGKTTYLIKKIDTEHRFLIVTYTDNNCAHLRKSIINRFGYEPHNITLLTYFQFLIRVCYRPFLKDTISAKGITFKMPDKKTLKYKRDSLMFFMTAGHFLYHSRIAKLCQDRCAEFIRGRIEKYYDYFMIDEVQDLGGHDFNFVQAIVPQKTVCLFVGDFYQHTYNTSMDGNTNSKIYDKYAAYKKLWEKIGFIVDEQTLSNSYRCSPTICSFVTEKLGISILSNRQDETKITYIDSETEADALLNDDKKIKLFYSDACKYNCFALNWGGFERN